ncbi:MAG TPA: TraR/DksA C4-type zinc finger protein [Candidatus Limnocylindria bacterium]|nr:TraR/DksA C4-type zinc finger protein [Candidatus Limnocylindria bacterium]
MDRRAARERLRRERDELSSALAAVSERLAVSQSESGGELSLADQHPADAATETMQRELDLTHQRRFEAKLARVDAALARIDAGTYGTCTVCGSTIPDERLEILPETPYCVKDAAKEERET